MATSKADNTATDQIPQDQYERRTSVSAHIVRSIGVTMSYSEMRALIDLHQELDVWQMTDTQRDVIRELRQRVDEIT